MTARAAARDILLRIEAAGQYADRALDAALSRAGDLSREDRALLTTLVYGTVEHRITLDAVIDDLATVAPSAIERGVRMTLRVALYQLIYLSRIPDHAAINEAVEMTPRRTKGFVNAVLRSFCRGGKQIPLPDPEAEPIRYLSVCYSVPEATARVFCDVFGGARAASILAAFGEHAPLTVRVNTLRLTREEFLKRVEGSTPTKNAPFGVYLPNGSSLRELIAEGLCFVQDEASQIAVEALDVRPHMRVLDLCAAPGSKSFGAALALENKGEIRSFDLHENKLSFIRDGAARLGITTLTAAAGDARCATPDTLGTFDRVICDVPCSGFGVLAKKPDIRYKNIDEARGLVPVQAAILTAAAALVKVGGVMVYSTCTLLPSENEEQVMAFLAAHPEFSLTPFRVGEIHADSGMLTLTPDRDGTDGFFIAKLTKRAELAARKSNP